MALKMIADEHNDTMMVEAAKRLGYVLELKDPAAEGDRVMFVYPDRTNRYTPEVYRNTWPSLEDWKIQTSSYGTLKPEEIDEVIKGYQNAQEMVALLKLI